MFLFDPITSHHLHNNTQYYSLLGEIQLDKECQYIYQLHYSELKNKLNGITISSKIIK